MSGGEEPGSEKPDSPATDAAVLAAFLEELPIAVFALDGRGHPCYANAAAGRLLGKGADPQVSVDRLAEVYGARVAATGEPYPAERMPIVRALSGESAFVDDMQIVTEAGVVDLEVWAEPVLDDRGQVVYALAAFQDITVRRRMELEHAELYRQATRQSFRLDASHEVFTSILSGAHPDATLDIVVHRARELTHAPMAAVGVVGPDPTLLRVAAAAGDGADDLRGASLPLGGSATAEVIARTRTIQLRHGGNDGPPGDPLVGPGMGPTLLVPMAVESRPFGVMRLARPQGWDPFDDREIRMAESFAAEAAIAVAYGRARQDLARLAVLDDRERIARDLHDGVIQSLFSVGMGLSAVALRSQDQELSRRIEGSVDELDRVIHDLRAYIFTLRSGTLGRNDLGETLRRMAADLQDRSGLVVALHVDDGATVRVQGREAEVVHLVREALSNVVRHAGAGTCRVSVANLPHEVVIEVEDDGRGFDLEEARGRGQGLANLESRAGSLGGTFEIESSAGDGTTVRVRIPA